MNDFKNMTGSVLEERIINVWDTAEARNMTIVPDRPCGNNISVVEIPVKSNRATMLFVDVYMDCSCEAGQQAARGYKTSFVVEWEGGNTIYFVISSMHKIGDNVDLRHIKNICMEAGNATFDGTILEVGKVTWLEDMPPIRNNPYEDILINFLHPRYWDRNDWINTGNSALPANEYGLVVEWMYSNLWYIQKQGRYHMIAYTRKLEVDIGLYQAISIFTATDIRANFSVILDIDGVLVRSVDKRRGIGGGDEIRTEISGNTLHSITFELEQADAVISEELDVNVATSIRWMLLERKDTDPAMVAEVRGMPVVEPPQRIGDLETEILPIGILIGREEFLELRQKAKQPGPLRKMADEIIAEADAHLDYYPEQYVGRYLPVDLGNQGCERKVSPWDQIYHYNSCMIYSALAYALTGDLHYGQSARKVLFSTLGCDTWQAGFASRIPCGLPGYRAPFIESNTSEAVAVCYEFIYNLLSKEERRDVEDTLYIKGLPWIDMYMRLNGEGYLLNSNQGAAYTLGLVCAALVSRRSHPDVDGILERWIQWFPRMMGNYFKKDGGSNEGPGYWSYTMHCAASALVAISRYKGWDIRDYAPAHLDRTMEYMMHIKSLAVKRLGFLSLGDAEEKLGYPYMSNPFMFFAKYYNDMNALWLWHEYYNISNPPGNSFFGKKSGGIFATSGLLNFLFFADGVPSSPQLKKSKHFEICDRVTLRTGCDYGDILFFFEGGPQTFNHTHFDKGQFIFEAYGERFAADPGVIKYQDPAHLFYASTSYHNVATVSGKDQSYKDPDKAVILEKIAFEGQFDYIDADISNSYRELRRYRRRMLFVRPDYFLILDDIQSTEPGLEWNYHSCVPYRNIDLPSGLIRLQGKNAGMVLAVGASCQLTASTGMFEVDGEVITYNLVLVQKEKSTTMALAALLVPYSLEGKDTSDSMPAPEVMVEKHLKTVIYTVKGSWGSDVVKCRLDGGDEPEGDMQVIQVWRNIDINEMPSFEMHY